MPRSFDSVFYGAAGTSTGGASDDEFNRVSFLSHFDGANNGVNNVFDDGSSSNHTVTANGNVTQGSFGPFARPDGEWGVDLPANGDTINLGSSTDFNFAGDFSIEMFLMDSATDGIVFASHKQGVSTGYYFFNRPARLALHNEGDGFNLGNGNIQPVGVWYHLVISRQSGSMRVFIDGVLKVVVSNSSAITSSIYDFMIGGTTNSSGNLDFTCAAKVSNFRIVNGSCAAAYQTSSTTVGATIFAVPTGALTAVTNTKLLTCQSNRFVDNSASAHTATPTGNVAVTAFGPFLTSAAYSAGTNGASAYFRGGGTDDYLITANASSDFNLGTGQFTFECWVYLTSSAQQTIMGSGVSGSSSMFNIFLLSGVLQVHSPSAVIFSNAGTLQLNAWQHIVVERDSNNDLKAFLNGTQTATTNTTADFAANNIFKVGTHFNGTNDLSGYISDVRFIKGSGVAPSAGGPTAPLTAITNTKLLLNMADGQAIDSAAQNNLTLYGTAKTSTAQKKFGTASLLLDGNSDYAIFPNGATGGAGDWTIEMFIFPANVGSGEFGTILDNRPDDTNGTYQTLVLAAATLKFYVGGSGSSYRITSDDSLSANTWYHVALCKSGSSTKLFIDGTQTGSTFTDNVTYVNIGRTIIGAEASFDSSGINDFFNGYIDEMRLSNMARYTSNFTAPTAPFADKGQ